MSVLIANNEYIGWLNNLKQKVRAAQLKTVVAVNASLIKLYWELGQQIVEKQQNAHWGDKLINQIAADLKKEFPDVKGFSVTNLKYCQRFYLFYQNQIGQQAVDQFIAHDIAKIPWGHHIIIFTKSTSIIEAEFYIKQTIANNWNREILALQLKTNLFQRQGNAISNFKTTLPEELASITQQTIKDPYVFDFLSLEAPFKEKDIEQQLTTHITKFLLELGKGFAFVGKQYRIEVAENEYFIDLLFYHIHLKCYVVIELKNTKFIPEYTGKLNFYLSAVDSLLKTTTDNSTIGILLCRDKNNIEAEFALRDINKPMGISEFTFGELLPENLKSSLPSVEEIENELKKIELDK
ncbi:MAG TPA: PDDEXK nuclease domain-containing protein [Vicingus sp.]|nr:PDDEXK nuclease domain-containing protein [Vicingus sp.]HRP59797.1 PDDEXK nuclease domain-containing protein [Vicingus sp.]